MKRRVVVFGRLLGLLALLGIVVSCSKSGAPGAVEASVSASSSASASGAELRAENADPRLLDLWRRAMDGEADDLIRLADAEGSTGLVEAARDPGRRRTAIRALAYAHDFEGLPLLAKMGTESEDGEARDALESAIDLAARPRRAVDPEDAAELKEGCDALLALAKSGERPKARRILAIRALRMLADRGCVKSAEIPGDLDVK